MPDPRPPQPDPKDNEQSRREDDELRNPKPGEDTAAKALEKIEELRQKLEPRG